MGTQFPPVDHLTSIPHVKMKFAGASHLLVPSWKTLTPVLNNSEDPACVSEALNVDRSGKSLFPPLVSNKWNVI